MLTVVAVLYIITPPRTYLIIILFKKIILYWRIIAFQHFAVFCQTSTWISHRCTYVPSLLTLPPVSLPSHPSRGYRASVWVSWGTQQIPVGYLFYIWKTVWRFLKKLRIKPPCDPAIPLLGVYPEETKIERATCVLLFTAALFTIARTWKQPRCSSPDEWIKKSWYIYTQWNITPP